MVNNNIDINAYKDNNGILEIIDDDYHKRGFVNQLFKMFKNNANFCIMKNSINSLIDLI